MSSAGNRSMHSWETAHGRRAALVAPSFGLLLCAAVSAAEPPVTVDYQSSFTGYRRFDAQAPTVAWRSANDAIGGTGEGAAHGMHGMHGPADPSPADSARITADDLRRSSGAPPMRPWRGVERGALRPMLSALPLLLAGCASTAIQENQIATSAFASREVGQEVQLQSTPEARTAASPRPVTCSPIH